MKRTTPRRAVAHLLTAAATLALYGLPAGAEVVVDGNNVTFRLDARQWTDKPKAVSVAGTFQGWNKETNLLQDTDGDHLWEGTFKIAEDGEHQYKFVVDGERWIADASGDPDLEIDDTFGGKNSGLVVGFDIRKATPPAANAIATETLRHDPTNTTDADFIGDGKARLRLRAQAGDVERAEVVPTIGQPQVLHKVGQQGGFDVFAGIVDLGASVQQADNANDRRPTASYLFRLTDGTATHELKAGEGPFAIAAAPVAVTPGWAKSAVWYQIFPERFRNGESANDPGDKPGDRLVKWTSDWWKTQPGETPGDENFYKGAGNVWQRRYGGDIQGVKQSLPYLRELGINAIYLNPVFEGESMHKYDTADFRHIDDNFGTKGDIAQLAGETDDPATWQWTASDKIFLDFIEEAHRQGFKVVIDGVFNHVGRAHPFFRDVLQKGKSSKYADWFEITDWGDEANWREMDDPYEVHGKPGGIQWKAWDQESGHLPVFKKDDKLGLAPGPRDHIMAITKRWLAPDGDPSKGIDGWRLDVPGDIPHPFWIEWRKLVKSTKPDAYITGEIWTWAQAWLNKGDQFDAVMNYQFAMPAQQFLVNEQTQMQPSEFASRLSQVQMAYPFSVALSQMNLYDSHDTDRLASMFVNPDRPYDGANRPQDNAAQRFYSPAKPTDAQWARVKSAATLQYTFVGAPMIYYGTEAGMWSPDDPSNRQPMVWRDLLPYEDPEVAFKADLFAHYQRLAAVRDKLGALREGFYMPLIADDANNVLAYRRSNGDQHAYVVINRSGREQQVAVPVAEGDHGKPFVNWLDDAQATLIVPDTKADPKGRPVVKPTGNGALLLDTGKVQVTLPAYGTAILSQAR